MPVIAAILLWLRFEKAWLLLLLASMSGAFVFGLYYHFILVSRDNVFHLPSGHGPMLFQVTAVAIALIELAGGLLAAFELRKQSEAPVEPKLATS